MMKPPKALICTALVALAAPVIMAIASTPSQAAAPSPAEASPLLGQWVLNTSRLPMPPEKRPKRVIFTFSEAGNGAWNVHVDIVHDNNAQVHSVSTARLDGTPAVLEHSPEADTVALKQPAPNVLVMALQQEGTLVSTRIYTVLPDDHTLIETAVYPSNDGKLVMKTNYFTRLRDD